MGKRRCFLYESNRSLLIYLLLTENLKGRNIYISLEKNDVLDRLIGLKIIITSNSKNKKMRRSIYKRCRGFILNNLKEKIRKNLIDIYGLPHILLGNNVFSSVKMHLLDDGLVSLKDNSHCVYRAKRGFIWQLDNILDKIYPKTRNFWADKYNYVKNCEEILYTPYIYERLENKKELDKCINLKELWAKKNETERRYICSVFGVEVEKIARLPKNIYWLFTQTLSEDGIVTEEEKIEIYRKIVSKYDGEVIIKPHPRETTNYRSIFNDKIVFDGVCPVELLACMGLAPKKCITLFSTAVIEFYGITDIDFYGTEVHPKLFAVFGNLDKIFKRNAFIE